MENRSHALMAGFFTIGLLIATIAIAIWFGKDTIQRKPFEIATRLPVAGLNLQAAVRYKGIKVGNVTDIHFDRQSPGLIVVRLEVVESAPITKSTFATLAYQGVTGIAYVMLDDDGSQPMALATSGDAPSRIPLKPGLFQNLEQRGVAILAQTEELTKKLNAMLDPANPRSVVVAVDSIGKAASAWQGVPAKLDPLLNKLPALSDQATATLGSIKYLSDDAGKLSHSLNDLSASLQAKDGTIAKLNKSVERLSNGIVFETLPKVNGLTTDARTTLHSLNHAANTLNDRPQSILFGNPPATPGPGEPGFSASGKQ